LPGSCQDWLQAASNASRLAAGSQQCLQRLPLEGSAEKLEETFPSVAFCSVSSAL